MRNIPFYITYDYGDDIEHYDAYDYANVENPTSYTIDTKTFTLKAPIKNGYTFTGWTGTGITNGPQTTVTIEKGSTGDREYTANWEAATYSISYTLNGGTITNKLTSYTIESADITLPTPTKNGYTFTGWTGTGITNGPQTTVTIKSGSTGNRTYTANWSETSYTLTLSLAGGSLDKDKNITSYSTNKSVTLPRPTKKGYTFAGWTGSNGKTPQTTVTIKSGSTGNRTYTANWTISNYKIDYK